MAPRAEEHCKFLRPGAGKVRTKDLGSVRHAGRLVTELKGLSFDENEKKGFLGFFKKTANNITELKAKYDKAEVNVDKITGMLQQHQITLSKDIVTMDKMYEFNQDYFKELTMYIIAGKLRAAELREKDLPALQKKAQETGLPEDAQAANDFASMIGRLRRSSTIWN